MAVYIGSAVSLDDLKRALSVHLEVLGSLVADAAELDRNVFVQYGTLQIKLACQDQTEGIL